MFLGKGKKSSLFATRKQRAFFLLNQLFAGFT